MTNKARQALEKLKTGLYLFKCEKCDRIWTEEELAPHNHVGERPCDCDAECPECVYEDRGYHAEAHEIEPSELAEYLLAALSEQEGRVKALMDQGNVLLSKLNKLQPWTDQSEEAGEVCQAADDFNAALKALEGGGG